MIVSLPEHVQATLPIPGHFICQYVNTFEGKHLPVATGSDIGLWGAAPEGRMVRGKIGQVIRHERQWVEVEVTHSTLFFGEPIYHLRLPTSIFTFTPLTALRRYLTYPFLNNCQPKHSFAQPLPALFQRSDDEYYMRDVGWPGTRL
jgi:hypothetical protein